MTFALMFCCTPRSAFEVRQLFMVSNVLGLGVLGCYGSRCDLVSEDTEHISK